jgi:hypothetical protein
MLRPHLAIACSDAIVQPSGRPCSRSHSVGVIRRSRTGGNDPVVIRSTISAGSESRPPTSSSGSVSSTSNASSVSSHESVSDVLVPGVSSGRNDREDGPVVAESLGSGPEPTEDDGLSDVLLSDVTSGSDGENGIRGSVSLDLRGEMTVPLDDDRLADELSLSGKEGVRGSVVAGEDRSSSGRELDDEIVDDVLVVIRREWERPVTFSSLEGLAASSVGRSDDDAMVAISASCTSGQSGSFRSIERLSIHAAVRAVIENRSGVPRIRRRDNEEPPSRLR